MANSGFENSRRNLSLVIGRLDCPRAHSDSALSQVSITRQTANQVINRLQVILSLIEQRNAPEATRAVKDLGTFVNLQAQLSEPADPRRD